MSTAYSIGQANKLMDALENAGFSPDDVTRLEQFKGLAKLKAVLNDMAQIVIKHVIDCDADPFVPAGWQVEEHIKGGQVEWNPADVELFLDDSQQDGKSIVGNKLRKQLAGKKNLNANVLDFLLAHPELIPEEWKGKAVFFWGTIYRRSDGFLYVRFLYWRGDRWDWDYHWLDGGFISDSPAAFRK